MAPRQLLLELEEVDMAAEKGSKRVRVDRADESSSQQKTPSGVAAPPITTTAKAVYYNPLRGLSNFNLIFDSFVKPKPNTRLPCKDRPLPTSYSLTHLTVSQMVSSSFDPFLPTAEELAGDGPALRDNDDKPSERQASITHARLAPPVQHHTQKTLLA
eukprot:scaffold10025_cov119-Isochrysis_galbana.AAC.11